LPGNMKFELETQAMICSLCPNMCRFLCPVSAVEKNETITPRGKGTLVRALDRGEIGLDAGAAEVFYHCAGCKVCREHCPSEVDLPEVMDRYRVRAAREGLAPAAARTLARRLGKDRSLYRPAAELAEGLTRYRELLSPGARVLYFAGCSTAALYPEIIETTLRLFEAAGVKVDMLEPEECCGLPLYTLGYRDEAAEFARTIETAVKGRNCETIVSGCPMCVEMMRERYPSLGVELGAEVRHVTEFLGELAEQGTLTGLTETAAAAGSGAAAGRGSVDAAGTGSAEATRTGSGEAAAACGRGSDRVTYHDPCYLGRWLGVYDAPRRLLAETAGVDLVEMESTRGYAACCGGSAAVSAVTPETATRITLRRLEEAARTGAGALITACPHCLEMFRPAAPDGLAVRDITEILAERLGVAPRR